MLRGCLYLLLTADCTACFSTLPAVTSAAQNPWHLQSPGWKFTPDEPHLAVSIGGPLYTGHLPTKLPEEYCAMLPFRPTPEQKVRPAKEAPPALLGQHLRRAEHDLGQHQA